MASVISEIPIEIRRFSYDWDRWFDGNTWELVEGVDYYSFDNIKSCAYYQARGRGKKVSLQKNADCSRIYLRAVNR